MFIFGQIKWLLNSVSKLGPIAFDSDNESIFLGRFNEKKKIFSKKSKNRFSIISIANKCINDAIYLLSDKVPLMDILVDELVDKEALEAIMLSINLNHSNQTSKIKMFNFTMLKNTLYCL